MVNWRMLENLRLACPDKRVIHVGLDCSGYRHATLRKRIWNDRDVHLTVHPAMGCHVPRFDPHERPRGVMCCRVTRNRSN